MADDIVTRLRYVVYDDVNALLIEAANEIERIRAIANYAQHNDGCEQPLHGIQRVCNCGLLDLLEDSRD